MIHIGTYSYCNTVQCNSSYLYYILYSIYLHNHYNNEYYNHYNNDIYNHYYNDYNNYNNDDITIMSTVNE